jgi:hypothetical protein
VILSDYVVLILAGAVIDVRAEFLSNVSGVVDVAVSGDLLWLDLGS